MEVELEEEEILMDSFTFAAPSAHPEPNDRPDTPEHIEPSGAHYLPCADLTDVSKRDRHVHFQADNDSPSLLGRTAAAASPLEDSRMDVSALLSTPEESEMMTIDRIYEEFAHALSQYQLHSRVAAAEEADGVASGGDAVSVLVLVGQFETICNSHLRILRTQLRRIPATQARHTPLMELTELLREELWTWRLLKLLLGGDEEVRRNERQPSQRLMESDSEFARFKALLAWCRRNSLESISEEHNEFFFGAKSFLFENTLHRLKQSGDRSASLDPDFLAASDATIDDADGKNELRFHSLLFAYIKAGQFDKATQLCEQCGQAWLSSVMAGAQIEFDPNEDQTQSDVISGVEGNTRRRLWKTACWSAATDPRFTPSERGLYGALCGHIDAALPLCRTWHDCVWTYANAAVESRLARGQDRMQNDYLVGEMLAEIDRGMPKLVSHYTTHPSLAILHRTQRHVITSAESTLLPHLREAFDEDLDVLPSIQALRFAAHLAFVLGEAGRIGAENTADVDDLLDSYITYLIDERRLPLIATYCATLSTPQTQVDAYTRLCMLIADTDERRAALQLADDAGLPRHAVCARTAALLRQQWMSQLEDNEEEETVDTSQVVGSVEWLLFSSEQRLDAVVHANAIARRLLLAHNSDDCATLFEYLPADSDNVTQQQLTGLRGRRDAALGTLNAVVECQSFSSYIKSVASFKRWSSHMHSATPTVSPITPVATRTRSAQKLNDRARRELRSKKEQSEIDRWHTIGEELATKMGAEDQLRQEELTALRQLHLPLVAHLYMEVADKTENGEALRKLEAMLEADSIQGVIDKTTRKKILSRRQKE